MNSVSSTLSKCSLAHTSASEICEYACTNTPQAHAKCTNLHAITLWYLLAYQRLQIESKQALELKHVDACATHQVDFLEACLDHVVTHANDERISLVLIPKNKRMRPWSE